MLKSDVEIRPAVLQDVWAFCDKVRASDRAEIIATFGMPVATALANNIKVSSEVYVGLIDGEFVAMFGLSEKDKQHAYPWLIGSDLISEHGVVVGKASARFVRKWKRRYPFMENWVHSEHKEAIEWLKWLGFKVSDKAEPYGVFGEPFYRFTYGEEQCAIQS